MALRVKRRDKSRLEAHSSSSSRAQQRQHKIRGAWQCPNKAKYKAQNKTRLEVHSGATVNARQSQD